MKTNPNSTNLWPELLVSVGLPLVGPWLATFSSRKTVTEPSLGWYESIEISFPVWLSYIIQ